MRRLLAAVLAAVVLLPAVGCAVRPAEPESGKLSFSHKWEERFGYPPASLCPKDEIPMAAYIHPDDLRALRALSGDLEGKAYLETEARIVTAQGRYRWNRLRLSFLRAEDGALGTVVGVLIAVLLLVAAVLQIVFV